MFFNVLHSAADEITAGRMDQRAGARTIVATLLAAFTAPRQRVPDTPG